MPLWEAITTGLSNLKPGSILQPKVFARNQGGSPLHPENIGNTNKAAVNTFRPPSPVYKRLFARRIGANRQPPSTAPQKIGYSAEESLTSAWELVIKRTSPAFLCSLARVSRAFSILATLALYRDICLEPRSIEACDYKDLIMILYRLNRPGALSQISHHTKTFTIGVGWYRLRRRYQSSRVVTFSSRGNNEGRLEVFSELSMLLSNIITNIEPQKLTSFILGSPIPLSPYVFSKLTAHDRSLQRLNLNLNPQSGNPRYPSEGNPLLSSNKQSQIPVLRLHPVNLLKVDLYQSSLPLDESWWNTLHNVLAACAPTLRHIRLEFPHINPHQKPRFDGSGSPIPRPAPPTLSQLLYTESPQNAGSVSLTLWSLHLSGFQLGSEFIHWTFPKPRAPNPDSSEIVVSELHLFGCCTAKYQIPRGQNCGPMVLCTDSFGVLGRFVTRSSASWLQRLELLLPDTSTSASSASMSKTKDEKLINQILASVPQLRILKLPLGVKITDKTLRKLLHSGSKLEELEIEVAPKQWRLFIGLLRQMKMLKRVLVLGVGPGGMVPVKGGNGMRQRGLADDAKELAGAAVSNRELRIVGRQQFLWEVIGIRDDKKRIKRIPIHR